MVLFPHILKPSFVDLCPMPNFVTPLPMSLVDCQCNAVRTIPQLLALCPSDVVVSSKCGIPSIGKLEIYRVRAVPASTRSWRGSCGSKRDCSFLKLA